MRLSIIQMESGYSVDVNKQNSLELLRESMKDRPELVVFPEYQMLLPDYNDIEGTKSKFQKDSGDFVSTFREFSSDNAVSIMINIAELHENRHFNTAIFISGGKVIGKYRKTHLFDAYSFKESSVYDPGDGIPDPVELSGFRIGPMICYDIRFPELAGIYRDRFADILVYQAGWYSGNNKLDLWTSLLRSRATENGCFSVGSAQCGPKFTGHSGAFSPYGNLLGNLHNEPGHVTFNFDQEELGRYRKDVPLKEQRRTDLYRLTY